MHGGALHPAECRAVQVCGHSLSCAHLKSPRATASLAFSTLTATVAPSHFARCTVPNSPLPTCSRWLRRCLAPAGRDSGPDLQPPAALAGTFQVAMRCIERPKAGMLHTHHLQQLQLGAVNLPLGLQLPVLLPLLLRAAVLRVALHKPARRGRPQQRGCLHCWPLLLLPLLHVLAPSAPDMQCACTPANSRGLTCTGWSPLTGPACPPFRGRPGRHAAAAA